MKKKTQNCQRASEDDDAFRLAHMLSGRAAVLGELISALPGLLLEPEPIEALKAWPEEQLNEIRFETSLLEKEIFRDSTALNEGV